jgi:hypothetical protein
MEDDGIKLLISFVKNKLFHYPEFLAENHLILEVKVRKVGLMLVVASENYYEKKDCWWIPTLI